MYKNILDIERVIIFNRISKSIMILLLVLFFISCKNNEVVKDEIDDKEFSETESYKDSILISIHMEKKSHMGFNIYNHLLESYSIKFKNKSSKDSIISRKIPKEFNSQTIMHGYGNWVNGVPKLLRDHFFISKNTFEMHFEFKNNKLKLKNNIFNSLDSLHNDYDKIADTKKEDYSTISKDIDSLYNYYNKKYTISGDKQLSEINYHHKLNQLQRIDPFNKQIDAFLNNIKNPTASRPLSGILYVYAKNRIHKFDFKILNETNYTKEYIKYLSMSVFRFLKIKKNIDNPEYQPARDWLKTTEIYRENKEYIEKEISPLDNNIFKEKLKNLKLLDSSFNEISFGEMIKKNPSKLYLIDFWATCCGPCIGGIIKIKEMDIPKNVVIINLSLDKPEVQEKWKTMAKDLDLKISYLVKKDEENKEFTKFLEIKSIPRYVLIDRNMNLIDESFYKPHDLQFLTKLREAGAKI